MAVAVGAVAGGSPHSRPMRPTVPTASSCSAVSQRSSRCLSRWSWERHASLRSALSSAGLRASFCRRSCLCDWCAIALPTWL